MVHSVLRWLSAALVVSLGGLDAQCEPRWLQGDWAATAFLGAAPELCAAQVWDPDGPGPEGPRLAIAGRFGHADPACNHIAIWDPALADWSAGAALGGGLDGAVSALANLPNGELIVGGAFLAAGAVGAARIASWDGSTWSPLGSGLDGDVLALTTTVGGEVVAAGEFTHAGGLPANRIARWDGVAWQPFGFGMDARVRALAAMPNGDLIAGGEFTSAGGVGVNGIARWNGSGWQPLGAGVNGAVHRLAVLASGELLVGGQFSFAGGVPIEALARWDGSGWHAVAPVRPGGTIRAIVELPNGDLVVGGSFQVAGVPGADDVARWDGVSWHAMGAGADDTVAALAILPDGALLAAGSFRVPGDLVAIWDGQRWNGTTGVLTPIAPTYAVHAAGDGAVYVGGAASFLDLGSGLRHPVARWDGRRWHALEERARREHRERIHGADTGREAPERADHRGVGVGAG